jgi:hypothetical protein
MDGASPPDRLSLEAHLGAPEISTGYSSQEGPAHRERIVRHHWRRMVSHKPKEKRSARFAVILVLRQAKFPVGPPTRRREGQKVRPPCLVRKPSSKGFAAPATPSLGWRMAPEDCSHGIALAEWTNRGRAETPA